MLFSILSNTLSRRNSLESLAARTSHFLINSAFPLFSRAQVETYLPRWCWKQKQRASQSKGIKLAVQLDAGQIRTFSREVSASELTGPFLHGREQRLATYPADSNFQHRLWCFLIPLYLVGSPWNLLSKFVYMHLTSHYISKSRL